jgi:hypothetical protein
MRGGVTSFEGKASGFPTKAVGRPELQRSLWQQIIRMKGKMFGGELGAKTRPEGSNDVAAIDSLRSP